MKPKALRNIRRMDDDSRSTHAWLVQVQRHNQIAIKMFSDSVWGGKRKALAAARSWRDEHKQAPAEQAHALWLRNRLRSNNRSGLVGVSRHERKADANDHKTGGAAFWLASWTGEQGRTRQRKFSVKRWGERGAKQKAIAARAQGVSDAVAVKTAVRAS
jgi:hypothetical protein